MQLCFCLWHETVQVIYPYLYYEIFFESYKQATQRLQQRNDDVAIYSCAWRPARFLTTHALYMSLVDHLLGHTLKCKLTRSERKRKGLCWIMSCLPWLALQLHAAKNSSIKKWLLWSVWNSIYSVMIHDPQQNGGMSFQLRGILDLLKTTGRSFRRWSGKW